MLAINKKGLQFFLQPFSLCSNGLIFLLFKIFLNLHANHEKNPFLLDLYGCVSLRFFTVGPYPS
jgi:hypothetical protein